MPPAGSDDDERKQKQNEKEKRKQRKELKRREKRVEEKRKREEKCELEMIRQQHRKLGGGVDFEDMDLWDFRPKSSRAVDFELWEKQI